MLRYRFKQLGPQLYPVKEKTVTMEKLFQAMCIYKDDIKTNPNNYRPISVLPIVSKLIERIVFNHLYALLMRHDLLADAQSGFRPCHSTLAIPL